MAPSKTSKKRKTDDSLVETKETSIVATGPKTTAKKSAMSDDESVDSTMENKQSKLEKKELKELLKNYMVGGKLLNVNTDIAKPERLELFERLEKKGLVEIAKEKTVTIKSYRLTEEGINQGKTAGNHESTRSKRRPTSHISPRHRN
ncbi:MAG: hypothetical protein SGARI_002978 [Bacillariaceae sp.]